MFVFFVFLVVGPPLGAAILFALATGFVPPHGVPASVGLYWRAAQIFGGFSYLFGGLQAAFVGLVAMSAQWRRRSPFAPFWPPLIASMIAAVAFLTLLWSKSRNTSGPDLETIVGFFGLHVGAATGCWLVANASLWPFRNASRAVTA